MRRWGRSDSNIRAEYSAIGGRAKSCIAPLRRSASGQILIAQRALSTIERSVKVSHVGDLKLKGFHRPIAAYDVLSWCEQHGDIEPSAVITSEGGARVRSDRGNGIASPCRPQRAFIEMRVR